MSSHFYSSAVVVLILGACVDLGEQIPPRFQTKRPHMNNKLAQKIVLVTEPTRSRDLHMAITGTSPRRTTLAPTSGCSGYNAYGCHEDQSQASIGTCCTGFCCRWVDHQYGRCRNQNNDCNW